MNILNEAKQQGLKLCLHCGEVKNDEEITEMLKSGLMDRIGHGTFIFGKKLKRQLRSTIQIFIDFRKS